MTCVLQPPQGVLGTIKSGKSALVHRYLTGSYLGLEPAEGEFHYLSPNKRPSLWPSLHSAPWDLSFPHKAQTLGSPKGTEGVCEWGKKNNILYLDMECKKLEKACRIPGLFPTYLIEAELWVT